MALLVGDPDNFFNINTLAHPAGSTRSRRDSENARVLLSKTESVVFNEFELRPRFKKSLDLPISSVVGYFKKINAILVYALFIKLFTVNDS